MPTLLFDGIAYGMLLFVLALGLAVTMGLMNFINLAHGAFAMAGGYIVIVGMQRLGWPFLACLPVAFVATAAAGEGATLTTGAFTAGFMADCTGAFLAAGFFFAAGFLTAFAGFFLAAGFFAALPEGFFLAEAFLEAFFFDGFFFAEAFFLAGFLAAFFFAAFFFAAFLAGFFAAVFFAAFFFVAIARLLP